MFIFVGGRPIYSHPLELARRRAPPRRRRGAATRHEELRAELHELARELTLPSLAQVIRLLESDKFEALTDEQIRGIGEYQSIEIEGETFFDKAFSSGKAAAASLGFAMSLGREVVLEDLKQLLSSVRGSGTSAARH